MNYLLYNNCVNMRKIILNNHQFELLQESIKEKLAAERNEVNTNPTEKQCKAGNYAMGHISINGFEITIENPKGSYRKGKDCNGKEWKTLMHNDYGYFTKTKGKDGDAIDVFLGPYLDDKIEDAKIYPVDQFIDDKFDETKVMMGFRDKESAKSAYLSNYDKDWKGFKYITEVDIDTFKKWLYDGYRQRKPFAKYVTLTEMIKGSIIKEMSLLREAKNSVNMNVELRKGGRNAVKMTEGEFEEELKALFEKYMIEKKPEYLYDYKWSIWHFVYKCCYKNEEFEKSKILGTLYNDIWNTKYKFDSENVESRGKIKMSSKGVPYVVCYAGGDWECPVCFIIYFDGSKVRAYIPLKGNAINKLENTAFGYDTDKEIEFISKELNISQEESKSKTHDINFDERACVEDFLSRIEVKGVYKQRDYSKLHEEFENLKKDIKKNEEEETPVNESMINEKFNSSKLAQMAKEHGGIEVGRNGGLRDGAKAWQRGYSIDLSQVTDDMIEGEPFTPERWGEEPNAICFNDGTMVKLKKYSEVPAPEKKRKPSKYMTGIGDTGDHSRKTTQGQEYNPWGVSQRAAEVNSGRKAIQNNKNDIEYVNNHKNYYPNWQKLTYDANKNIQDIKDRIMKRLDEARAVNPPKDEVAAINKANREEDIAMHGKPTAFRGNITKNPKAYTRKEKHKEDLKNCDESCGKKIYMTEEQFKNYCRTILQEKRKEDYIKGLLK